MSQREFLGWVKYRELRGSFNVGMRIEAGFALLASMAANYINGTDNHSPQDFMPHNPRPEPTVEEAMQAWG